MRTFQPLWLLLALVPVQACTCNKQPTGSGPAGSGGQGQGSGPTQAALAPIGMLDPFPRLSGPTGKALERGYKALRAKKPEDAVAAFQEVVTAAPDHTRYRFELARALNLTGKFAEARAELEQVLARDFIAYAGRVDKPKEWKPFRESPEWAAYQAAEGRYKAAYGQGLDKGFVFVARSRPAKPLAWAGDEAKLDLSQEVYHFDPQSARYRRLTWTDGRVYAASRSPDGKTLAFIAASKLRRGERGDLFIDPQGGYLDLATLETVGPFKISGTFYEVSMGFASGEGGQVQWATESAPGVDGGTFGVDTARTGMAKLASQPQGVRTWAQVAQVWRSGKGNLAGVTMSADHRSFTLEGAGQVTSARELLDSSLDWSPGKKRLTYAGKLDACRILKENDKTKNELYVYDIAKKSAQRVDNGISEFETLWLTDDLLAYENGIGNEGTVNLYDFTAHQKTPLKARHGAGLYGVPSLNCQEAAAAKEPEAEPETPPEEQQDGE